MLLREIMKKDLITVRPETFVTEAAKKMKEHNVGCILVTENGSLKGLFTDRDIACWVVAEGRDPNSLRIKDVMKTDLVTATPDTDIFYASKIMAQKRIRRLPIQSNGHLEGIVSIADLAPVLKEELDNIFTIEEAPTHRY